MMIIHCSACQKPVSLDETKLPMREVTFGCPACKARIAVDRRTQGAAAGAEELLDPNALHPGEKALVVGVDDPAVAEAARAIGYHPHFVATAEEGRAFFLVEYPSIIFLRPEQVGPPPLVELQPLTSLTPADRRKAYLILVAETLRTFDGNAAFLYEVNLVVSSRDLHAFRQVWREAESFQRQLYQHFQLSRAS
ncbi:MAG: hypothetical protein ABI718_05150 [Acidobacteriota bacterium]